MSSSYPELFAPLQVGHTRLRNRIIAPPMLQMRSIISPEGIAWYRRLAAGGAAMVIVEVTSILRFGTELTAQSLRPLVEAIHAEGAAAGIQLFPVQFRQEVDPNTLTSAQIGDIIEGYARATRICRDAGFDAVEPHGAHGYLLNQFFMPDRNQRTDEFGGSLAGRGELAVRIVQAMRREAGDAMMVFYRHTPVGKAYGIDDSLELAARLVSAGVHVLDISPGRDKVEADLAAPFKKRFAIPVIAVQGMEDPSAASRALREGRCDLVAIGRALIADAQLPIKVRDGRESEIVHCEKCNIGCFGHIKEGTPVVCEMWEEEVLAGGTR